MKSQLPVREIFSILIMLVILGSEGQETGVLAEQFKLAGATTDAVSFPFSITILCQHISGKAGNS